MQKLQNNVSGDSRYVDETFLREKIIYHGRECFVYHGFHRHVGHALQSPLLLSPMRGKKVLRRTLSL